MTDITSDERIAPTTVVQEAKAISRENVAGRVKVEPVSDGWKVTIDIPKEDSSLPPTDVPMDEWHDCGVPTSEELTAFRDDIDAVASTDSINVEESADYERRVLNYD